MIIFDATSSGGYTGGTTLTVSHVVGTGSNRILLVGTSVQDNNHGNYPVTGITYGGVALTKVRSDEASGNNRTEIWYLLAPASGTANIIATTTGALNKALVAASFSGVAQATPYTNAGQTGNGFPPALSISTGNAGKFMFQVISTEATISSISAGTEIGPVTGQSFENAAGAYQGALGNAGSYSQSFGLSSGQSFAQSGVVITPNVSPSTFYVAPTQDFFSTTLKGQISVGSTLINLASIGSLQVPGIVVLDRTNNAVPPSSTPSVTEVIAFGSIASINILTGLTRAVDSSPTVAHVDGALVETVWTSGIWNSLTTIFSAGLDTQGLLLAISSSVSISQMQANIVYASVASIGKLNIGSRLNVSGASVTGLGFYPLFTGTGQYSGPTIAIGGLITAPRTGTLQWVSAITKYVASGTSVGFDFKKNGISIFANATSLPAISAGGTFVSTASIATKNINVGDLLQGDIASMLTGAGLITKVTIQGGII